MKLVTLQVLNEIVREWLRDAGCKTAEVRLQRFNDPGIPCNWDRSDFINYRDDDPDVVEAALRRIIPELQKRYRV